MDDENRRKLITVLGSVSQAALPLDRATAVTTAAGELHNAIARITAEHRLSNDELVDLLALVLASRLQ